MDTNTPDNLPAQPRPLAGLDLVKSTFTPKDQMLFPIYAKGLKKHNEAHYCFVFMSPTTCLWLSKIGRDQFNLSLMKDRYDFYQGFLTGRLTEIGYAEMQAQFQPLFIKLYKDLPQAVAVYSFYGSLSIVMPTEVKGHWFIQPNSLNLSYYEHVYKPNEGINAKDTPVTAELLPYVREHINGLLRYFTRLLAYQLRRTKEFNPSMYDHL